MSDVVVSQFITLDGVIESPGPEPGFEHAGWAFQFERGPEVNRFKFTELMSSGALLLGRVTYEGFAQAWPTMEGTGEFGEKMNEMPKYVVSSILVNGSAQLVQGLLREDLIDELRLMVFPIVLGSGKRLFGECSEPRTMRVSEVTRAGDTVVAIYRRARVQ